MPPIRVILVEDHAMVREGIAGLIRATADIELVDQVGTLQDGVAVCKVDPPDVVICDYQLPDGVGTALALALVDLPTRVLVISGLEHDEPVQAAILSGCAGFVAKNAGAAELIESVRRVASNAAVFPAGALADAARLNREPDPVPLTERESQVLDLLAQAASSEDIAAALNISLHTVRNHIRSTMSKLGAGSRLEAVVVAARSGLVDLQ